MATFVLIHSVCVAQEHTIYCPNDRVSTESVAVAIVALIQESKKRPAFILRYFEPDVQQMVSGNLVLVVWPPTSYLTYCSFPVCSQLKLSTYNPRAFLDEPSVYEVFQFMHKLFKKAQVSIWMYRRLHFSSFLTCFAVGHVCNARS